MMTACDVAAITKPWPIQLRVRLQNKVTVIPFFSLFVFFFLTDS